MKIQTRLRARRALALLTAVIATFAVAPVIAQQSARAPALTPVKDPAGTTRVIVFGGVTDDFLVALNKEVGSALIYRYEIIQGAAVAVRPDLVPRTMQFALQHKLRSERDSVIKQDLTNSARTVHVKANGQDTGAWGLGYNGSGITVGVIDSGIYAEHQSLNDLDDNAGTSDPKVVKFKDWVNNGGGGAEVAPYDDNDHGSHVSGIATGTGGETAPSQNIGMAFRANLAGFKVFNAAGAGVSTNFIAALNWIVNNPNAVTPRIRVVNYSGGSSGSGGGNNGNSAQSLAVDNASDSGVVVAAAGGNGTSDGLTPNLEEGNLNIPSDARKAISVCSSNSANPPAAPAYSDWDSEGPTGDGRIKPDVCAPGDGVAAANSPANGIAVGGGPTSYGTFGGTSMSTPHVSGIVALILQAVPTLTPAQVREVLYETARDYPSKDNNRGYGEVNARAAIQLAIARYGTPTALSVNHGGPYVAIQGETRMLTAVPTGGQPTYTVRWDLNDDGVFETTGANVSFNNTGTTGVKTVHVRVTDSAGTPATVTASTTVTVVPALSIFSDDVEGGTNGWITAGAPEGAGWHQTTVRSNSATHSWYPGNDVTQVYAPRQNLTLTRQFNLGTGPAASSGQLLLRFSRSGSLEPTFDFLNAKIREVGSPVTNTLESWDNYDGGNLWTTHPYDITAYRGKQVEVEFQFTSDDFNDVPFVDATGPFVDDIKIIGTPPTGVDTVAPGAITTLAAGAAGLTSIPLGWTTTGDDGASGTATSYDLRYSTSPITPANFLLATQVVAPAPRPAGQIQSFTVPGLAPNTNYYFAIKALDEIPNTGPISNVIRALTAGAPVNVIPGWPEAGGGPARTSASLGRASLATPNLLQEITMPALVDSSPLIADLNGDGKLDVIAASDATATAPITIRAFRQTPNGLVTMWTYTVPVLSGQNDGYANLALGQLIAGGPLELAVYSNNVISTPAVTSNQGRLAVLNASTGALIDDLPVDTADTSALVIGIDTPPAIGDVNGDGLNEIVLIHHVGGTTPGSFLAAIRLVGSTLVEQFDTNITAASNWRSLALAELSASHDGLEVVVGQRVIPDTNPSTGAVRMCAPNLGDAVCGQALATPTGIEGLSVADLDGDGQPEIVANGRTGQSLTVIRTFPELARTSQVDGFHWNTAALGDVDSDGKPDIVNVAHSGTSTRVPEHDPLRNGDVTVRGWNGTAITVKGTLFRTADPGENLHSKGGGTIVDLRGTTRPEYVFGSADNKLVAVQFNSPPTELWSLDTGAGAPQSPVAAGDVTGDGLADLIVGTSDGRLLVVGAGPVASLVISPEEATIGAGGSQTYTAEGFDAVGNALGDVTSTTMFSIAGGGSCTGNVCTSTVAGTHVVTGTNGAGTDTATLTVTPGPLDTIEVAPSTATITAGNTQAYTATALDTYGNEIGDVTATTAFSITPDGSCTGASCGSTVAGAHTVTGTHAGKTDTASLAVNPGPPATLTLAPANATITAGGSQAYTAMAQDQYGNSIGDVTGTTTFAIGPNGSCTGASCTATVAGPHTVTGTNGAAVGNAALTVNPGPITSLTLAPDNATITAGGSQAYTATGADQYGNSLGDVTGTTTFGIAPNGSCSGNSCSATVAGAHTVTGTNGPAIDTASLTVNAGPPATLVLAPANATITAGGTQAYTATGADQYGNPLGDITATTSFVIGPDGSCGGPTCTATVAGPHTVTGTNGAAIGTASLTVNPGPMDHIAVLPAVSSIVIGDNQTYTAEGRDVFENSTGDVTTSTTFSITPDGSCSNNICTPASVGDHTITATRNTMTAFALLHVLTDQIARIEISPSSATIVAGGSQAYTAEAFDANDVSIGDVTASTVFAIGPNGQCAGNICGAQIAGSHMVTGTAGGVSDFASLQVIPGPASALVLNPAWATIVTGASRTYSAQARDQFGNVIGDVTSSTTFSIAPNGSCTANSCSAPLPGEHTVTGVSGAASGTATLVVTPVAPTIATPPEGSTQPSSVLVSGLAPVGTTVDLYDNGIPIAQDLAVAPDGSWSITRTFSGGNHALKAYAKAAGTVSPASAIRSFRVDGTAPTVMIRKRLGYVLFDTFLPFETVTVSGTARDDDTGVARVEITYTDLLTGDELVSTITCSGPCGFMEWEDGPALGPGIHDVTAVAIDRAGNRSAPAAITIVSTSLVSNSEAGSTSHGGRVVE